MERFLPTTWSSCMDRCSKVFFFSGESARVCSASMYPAHASVACSTHCIRLPAKRTDGIAPSQTTAFSPRLISPSTCPTGRLPLIWGLVSIRVPSTCAAGAPIVAKAPVRVGGVSCGTELYPARPASEWNGMERNTFCTAGAWVRGLSIAIVFPCH